MVAGTVLGLIILATILMLTRLALRSSGRVAGIVLTSNPMLQGIALMIAGVLLGFVVARAIEYRRTDLERGVNLALTGVATGKISRNRVNAQRSDEQRDRGMMR